MFLTKQTTHELWVVFLLTILVLLGLLSRHLTTPSFIEDRDGLFFVQAVESYSVASYRPQWPGYPIYIWLAQGLNSILNQPVRSLHWISVLATCLSVVPIFLLTRAWTKTLHNKEDKKNNTNWNYAA